MIQNGSAPQRPFSILSLTLRLVTRLSMQSPSFIHSPKSCTHHKTNKMHRNQSTLMRSIKFWKMNSLPRTKKTEEALSELILLKCIMPSSSLWLVMQQSRCLPTLSKSRTIWRSQGAEMRLLRQSTITAKERKVALILVMEVKIASRLRMNLTRLVEAKKHRSNSIHWHFNRLLKSPWYKQECSGSSFHLLLRLLSKQS